MARSRSLIFALAAVLPIATQAQSPEAFVQRTGTKLTLNSTPFRYSGPNIEWLGLEGYGPHDPMGPRLPNQ